MPDSLADLLKSALVACLLVLVPSLRAQACADFAYFLTDIAVSPDGSLAYLTDEENRKIWVISLADHRTIRTGAIDGARIPLAIILTPDGVEALVATASGPIVPSTPTP